MEYIYIISWIASALGLAGAILNAEGNIKGFYFWLISNPIIIIQSIIAGSITYSIAFLFTCYTILAIRGMMKWKKDKKLSDYLIEEYQNGRIRFIQSWEER